MVYLKDIDEARARLGEITDLMREGELHSAVLLEDGKPFSVMVPWKDFCLMVDALEAISSPDCNVACSDDPSDNSVPAARDNFLGGSQPASPPSAPEQSCSSSSLCLDPIILE